MAIKSALPNDSEAQSGDTPGRFMYGELLERLNKNLADFYDALQCFGQGELIDMAKKISVMQDTHNYLTTNAHFYRDELEFYLQFKNPLEVVADEWQKRSHDISNISFACEELYERQNALHEYPLVSDAEVPKEANLRRYMDVDLELYLGKIAEKVIIHYPNDWKYDAEHLKQIAASSNLEEKRLLWHVCSTGTHLKNERDVFVRDSGAYEYMTDYHQNDSDMFGYVVEVTGRDGDIVKGNIFEVGDYAEYAKHIRDNALRLDSVTLTYSDTWGVNAGKTITVSRNEYDNDRHRLMSKSGNVIKVRFNPASEAELAGCLRKERSARMALPIGSTAELLQKMAERLAEVRKPSEQQEKHTAKSEPKTLAEKLKAAGEMAKTQDEKGNGAKPHKHEERE
jgi:hypothetical protein